MCERVNVRSTNLNLFRPFFLSEVFLQKKQGKPFVFVSINQMNNPRFQATLIFILLTLCFAKIYDPCKMRKGFSVDGV